MMPDEPTPSTARREWLASILLQRQARVMPRLLSAYAGLAGLGRNARRRLRLAVGRRRSAVAATALLLALSAGPLFMPRAHAAAITVGGTCSLVDAIKSANSDTSVGTCATGSGADIITLTGDVTLTTSYATYYTSATGLPLITSAITIDGDGFTIERDGGALDFRLMAVSPTGDLTLNDVTLSGGRTTDVGGAVYNYRGDLTLTYATISDNYAYGDGGGIFSSGSPATLTVTNSVIDGNSVYLRGGGLYNEYGVMLVIDSTILDNTARLSGGGVRSIGGTATISGSTITGNEASNGGGIYNNNYSEMTITNSTISGNEATYDGGGLYTDEYGTTTVTNSTITGNTAGLTGGGVYGWQDSTTVLVRSIVSGNSAPAGNEVGKFAGRGTITADADNVFGRLGITSAAAFENFTPGGSYVTATVDGSDPTPVSDILDMALVDNGGPTETHNRVADSPALNLAPGGDGAVAPTNSVDQRGYARPFGGGCDAGSVEFGSTVPVEVADIYVSTVSAGTTGDGLPFGPHDILKWDGAAWSKWFDGSAAGLMPVGRAIHNLNSVWIPDPSGDDVVFSFVQNARVVPGVPGKVNGMDLVWWDGSAFSLWFDGEDVGLTNKTQEKIDALHVLDGSESPIGGSCDAYLLISTQGDGQVPNYGGGAIKFDGTDVLGFCMTNSGSSTTGFWHRVLNGRAEGMPGQALTSLSASDDGETLYLTTRSAFNVDGAAGGHSMVYRYDFAGGAFSGPFFSAPANGLPRQVDALHVEGELP